MNDLLTDVDGALDGRREQNKASKRRRILTAATELFTEQGFESTTTAAIAKRAGIGAGTLYLYIESKDDLLVAVFRQQVDPVWDEAFSAVPADAPVLEQILAVFNHVADFHERDTKLAKAFFKNLRFVESSVIDGATEFVQSNNARLAELLDWATADGRLDPEVSTTDLAANMYDLWVSLMARRHAGRRTLKQYQAELERSMRTCLFRLVP